MQGASAREEGDVVKKSWVVLVVLVVLFMSVLGGGTAFARTADLSIYARPSDLNQGWQPYTDSPELMYIPQGQSVRVSPSGTWYNGNAADLWVGAQGYTASQSKGFMPYCKYPHPYSQSLPFGRLIAMTWINNNNYKLWDAGHAGYIRGPGYLFFRINERDGQCLDNNLGHIDVRITGGFVYPTVRGLADGESDPAPWQIGLASRQIDLESRK
jgi:hypothetical protein